jgi:membrane-bound lytic murein transglycosylase B
MRRLIFLLFFLIAAATSASAATCGGNFSSFLAAMSQEAQAKGISRGVIDQAFAGLTPDLGVLAFDRRQRGMFHAKSFEEYVLRPGAADRAV